MAKHRGVRTTAREILSGAAYVLRGLRTWGTAPRWMLLGLVPGAITAVAFGAGAFVLVTRIAAISDAIADALVGEDGWLSDAVQVVAALAVIGAAALIAIYTFTAITLLIGQPFFERLSREVDERAGHAGLEPSETLWRSLMRGVGEAARLALLTIPLAIALFLVGLLPVVGGAASFVLGAGFGGWFLALELTAYPLARRGHVALSQRRAVLAAERPRVVGFGAATFLLFLLPLGAVAFMPASVAGATLLTGDLAAAAGRPRLTSPSEDSPRSAAPSA